MHLYLLLLCCVVVIHGLDKTHLRVQPQRIHTTPPPKEYTSEWAVHLQQGHDPSSLSELGFEVVGPVANLEDIYLVRHKETHTRHTNEFNSNFTPSHSITASLLSFPHVKWAQQQQTRKHFTRSFSDPLFSSQWHLVNTGQFSGVAGEDVNIQSAWNAGFDGSGVQIAVVDDGFQYTHPDLAAHYVASASHNFNSGSATDPSPNINSDFHGTSAAGVALAASNSVCGIGSAYNAKGAGIRLIAEAVTGSVEATGVTYQNQVNDIYSNSWGPSDDGLEVGPQESLTTSAMTSAVANGRGGKGNVYIWAAGNGKQNGDNCNYDGYANSRFVIAVGAVDNTGKQSYYSENCAAIIVAAPSSSINDNAGIRTTDLLGSNGYSTSDCDSDFGGTSSACPLVAGITALVLQANPSLTWRDVAVIYAKTARKNDPTDSDWTTNGDGFHINHKYGFGVVDAHAAIAAAQVHIPLNTEMTTSASSSTVSTIPASSSAGVVTSLSITQNFKVERVVITVNIDYAYSNDLQIELTSPAGTKSILAEPHGNIPALMVGGTAYQLGFVEFGPLIPFTPITATVVATNPSTACSTLTNCKSLSKAIAAIDISGSCYCNSISCDWSSGLKAVQACGAVGAVFIDNDSSGGSTVYTVPGTNSSTITIPAGYLSYSLTQSLQITGKTVSLQQYMGSYNNYKGGWSFTTVRSMGENSQGTWTVQVYNPRSAVTGATATQNSVRIDVYGSDSTATFTNITTTITGASVSGASTATIGGSTSSSRVTTTSSASALIVSFVVIAVSAIFAV